jgi:DNA-binding response OmpR family regulator
MIGRIRELALYRAEVLRARGFEVATPESQEEAVAAVRKGTFDIAVLTYTPIQRCCPGTCRIDSRVSS